MTLSLNLPIPFAPFMLQHPKRDNIMILPVNPNTLPFPPLNHKAEAFIQFQRAFVAAQSFQVDPVQLGVVETPIENPFKCLFRFRF